MRWGEGRQKGQEIIPLPGEREKARIAKDANKA